MIPQGTPERYPGGHSRGVPWGVPWGGWVMLGCCWGAGALLGRRTQRTAQGTPQAPV